MEKSKDLYEILLKTLINGDVAQIIETVSEYFNCPTMLVDAKYKCLAHYPEKDIGDPLWDSIHKRGEPAIEFIKKFSDENMMEIGSLSKEPFIVNWGFLEHYPRIITKIIVQQKCLGYLACITEKNNEDIINKLKLIGETLSLHMQLKNAKSENISDYQTMFLINLLSGKIKSKQQLMQWKENIHQPYNSKFCILSACPKHQKDDQYTHYLQMQINKFEPSLHPIMINNNILFLLSGLKNDKDLYRHIDYLQKKLDSFELFFGSSYLFNNLEDSSIFVQQADFSLSICKEKKRKHVNYLDCALHNFSNILKKNIPLESIVHPAIERIRNYDKKYHTEYLDTLIVYLKNMCGRAETIMELNIHRNTLPHRIEMIEKLGDINLNNPDTLVHLYFNYKILNK